VCKILYEKTINAVSAPNGLPSKHDTGFLKVGKMIWNVILNQKIVSIFSSSYFLKSFSINKGIAEKV